MITKFITLSILLFASVGWSLNANVTFNTTADCKQAYRLSQFADAASETAQNNFCATRVFSGSSATSTVSGTTVTAAAVPVDVCVQTKLQALLARVPELNAIAQQNAQNDFKIKCIQEESLRNQQASNQTAINVQIEAQRAQAQAAADAKAAAAAAKSAPKGSAGAGKGGGDPDISKVFGQVLKATGLDKTLANAGKSATDAVKSGVDKAKAAVAPAKDPAKDAAAPATADAAPAAGTPATTEAEKPPATPATSQADRDKMVAEEKARKADADRAEAPPAEVARKEDTPKTDTAAAPPAEKPADTAAPATAAAEPAPSPTAAPDTTTPPPAAATPAAGSDVDGGIAVNPDGSLKTADQIQADIDKGEAATATPPAAVPVDPERERLLQDETARAEAERKAGCAASEFGCDGDVVDRSEKKELTPDEEKQVDAKINEMTTPEGQAAADAGLASATEDANRSFGGDPKTKEAVDALNKPNAATDPKTIITTSSDAAEQKIAATFQVMAPMFEAMAPANMPESGKALSEVQNKIHKYMTGAKKECTKATEKSDNLCKKETSPTQAKVASAAKAMEPVLKGIDSASKLLTLTADAAKLSAAGMTKASAECSKAKTSCDTTCEKATKELDEILAEIKKFQQTFQGELAQRMSECEVADPTPQYCYFVSPAFNTVSSGTPQITEAMTGEKTPTPMGTVQSLVVKCKVEHAFDIGQALKLIQDLMKSADSAKDGAKKLSSGNGGGTTKIAAYCELPDNKTTQFCTCQKDNTKEGCPGFIAKRTETAKPKDVAGKDLKSNGTNLGNSFATGFKPTTGFGTGINGLKTGSLNGKDAGKASGFAGSGGGKSGTSIGGGVVKGSGSSSSGFAGSSSGFNSRDPSSVEKGNSAGKKFNFGSFASTGGGAGGRGGSGGAGKFNGALLKKQIDAIKRQIASDKIAAEVSPASGKTNWEKIREMYAIKSKSLIIGQ